MYIMQNDFVLNVLVFELIKINKSEGAHATILIYLNKTHEKKTPMNNYYSISIKDRQNMYVHSYYV